MGLRNRKILVSQVEIKKNIKCAFAHMAGLLYDMFNHFHTLIYFEYFVLFSCSCVCMNLCTCIHTYIHTNIFCVATCATWQPADSLNRALSLTTPTHTHTHNSYSNYSPALSLSLAVTPQRKHAHHSQSLLSHTHTHAWVHHICIFEYTYIHVYIFMSPKDYRVSYPSFSVLNNLFNAYICIANTITNNLHA